MELKPIKIDISTYPTDLQALLRDANLYDSSCSKYAKVIFVDKDGGYFLKIAEKGALERQATMMQYFHGKGLSTNVLSYISSVEDWLFDVFWALWSMMFNLKTNDYRQRFIDAYGRDKIDENMLRLVAAVEVFG